MSAVLASRSCAQCDVLFYCRAEDKHKKSCRTCYDMTAPQENKYRIECLSCHKHFNSKFMSKSCKPCYEKWKGIQTQKW